MLLAWSAWLLALLASLGCGPYPQLQYQPYSPARGPQALAPVPSGTPGLVHLPPVEEQIWRYTNEIRRRSGCPPLAQEATLTSIARAYSDDMLRRRYFSHTNPEGLTIKERLMPYFPGRLRGMGENIWESANLWPANSDALARFIMHSWMTSADHRENILTAAYTHVGVGVSAMGREIRATQVFADFRRR